MKTEKSKWGLIGAVILSCLFWFVVLFGIGVILKNHAQARMISLYDTNTGEISNIEISDEPISYTMRPEEPDDTATIKRLAEEGKICSVFGHWWEYTTDYREYPVKMIRRCHICGRQEIECTRWEEYK